MIIVPIVVSVVKSLDHHLKRLKLDVWIKSQMQKAVLLDATREEVPVFEPPMLGPCNPKLLFFKFFNIFYICIFENVMHM